MQKTFYILAIACMAFGLASCSKEEIEPPVADNTTELPNEEERVEEEQDEESDDIAAKGYSWLYWNSNFDDWNPVVLTSNEIQMNLGDEVMIHGANKGRRLLQRQYTMKVVNANDIDNKVIEHKIDFNDYSESTYVDLKAVGVGHTNIQVEIATNEANPQVVLRRTFNITVSKENSKSGGVTLTEEGFGRIAGTSYLYDFRRQSGNASMTYYKDGTFNLSWENDCYCLANTYTDQDGVRNVDAAKHNFILDYSFVKSGNDAPCVGAFLFSNVATLYVIEDATNYLESWYKDTFGESLGSIEVDGQTYQVFEKRNGSSFVYAYHVRTTARQKGSIPLSEHLRKHRELHKEFIFGNLMGIGTMAQVRKGVSGSIEITNFSLRDE